jgi:hypothetical protein
MLTSPPIGRNQYGSTAPIRVVYINKNNKTVEKEFGADYYAARRFFVKLSKAGFEPHIRKVT